jgi:anti-sigma factor RsiW
MNPTREQLTSYLEDALSDVETAQVEQALRQSDALRDQLRQLMEERDRGDHSVGAIWRRHRLTCPSRAQLGSYLLGVLEPDHHDYVSFHLQTIGCSYCQANLTDLQAQRQTGIPSGHERRRRFFESSAGLLRTNQPSRAR